ncbi:group 3 secretory phospholipase A2 isoform X2 [Amblyraja radiata]|uniref:group 3 secretory phospholipase A2 isoform X2 n=1 Tax=Amblyraja radiata TaxID=386614 RepID=UPI001401E6D2|nr:group 3 secretory phospholipase A2 isoform X2 [Amblyraja radiata]
MLALPAVRSSRSCESEPRGADSVPPGVRGPGRSLVDLPGPAWWWPGSPSPLPHVVERAGAGAVHGAVGVPHHPPLPRLLPGAAAPPGTGGGEGEGGTFPPGGRTGVAAADPAATRRRPVQTDRHPGITPAAGESGHQAPPPELDRPRDHLVRSRRHRRKIQRPRFDQTDFCCREHDHCERKIAAFEYKYGTLNIRLHTVSHCDCDDRFKKCLLGVNNTISKMVGLTFFNLLKVPCFSLEPVKHCVKKSWLSSCQVTEAAPKAIFHSQSTFYDTQPPAGGAGEASWPTPTGSPKTTTRVNQNANGVSRGFVYPSSRLDTAQGARSMNKKKCKKCGGRQKQGTKAPSQDVLKWRAGSPRTCNCCRPLDRCEHKILPWEFKFSHYNQGPKTLYHCDCTRRLAKQMKGEVNVNRLKELFFKFVSHNCFQLKMSSKNCNQEELVGCDNRSSSPMAVLFKPRYLQRFLKVQRTAEESLSPLPDGQEGNQNATFNSTNSVKLYDKCLQMIRALTVKP